MIQILAGGPSDDQLSTALGWAFGAFIFVWVVIILVKILRDTWKDDD